MSLDTSSSTHRTGRIRSEDLQGLSAKVMAVKPERNLIAAILGRAILDLYGDTVSDRITVANARCWLNKPIDVDQEFSFGWIAKQLDLDPVVLREKLHSYAQDPERMSKCLNFLR